MNFSNKIISFRCRKNTLKFHSGVKGVKRYLMKPKDTYLFYQYYCDNFLALVHTWKPSGSGDIIGQSYNIFVSFFLLKQKLQRFE